MKKLSRNFFAICWQIEKFTVHMKCHQMNYVLRSVSGAHDSSLNLSMISSFHSFLVHVNRECSRFDNEG